jgi:hypothetical protein
MRNLSYLVAVVLLLTTPAFADCVTTNENDLSRHDCYVNKYHNERHVPSQDNAGVPPDAIAKCRDGAYSFSEHRSGTCSGHHGVAAWLKP